MKTSRPSSCRVQAQALESEALSRRMLLSGAAFVASAAAVGLMPMRARAQQKITQAAAQYQNSPKGDQRCDGCAHFQAPSSCQVVDGTISPSGWCALYVKKS
ncbi:high potential iron sulfur protein [uncultured Methylovirgula sp.]|uniref:high potential iron sulfur protein n=1 Tax=uncultured Methylovirgula sp. TaxID=1285960 RepID=UPI002625CA5B|nr:high potential iron sulfur protein [uncultured Methylovirgula sp.]